MRVRAFTQDDAHIFCTEEQSVTGSARYIGLQYEVYRDLGFPDVAVKLALRPDVRAGVGRAVGHRRTGAARCSGLEA